MESISSVCLENGANYLADTELIEIRSRLKEQGIELHVTNNTYPKASLNDISIFISQNVTELIITGLIMPMAYDIIKNTIKFVVKKIKENVKIMQSGEIREAEPSICYKTQNGEIIAPIPKGLTDYQFDVYLDLIRDGIQTIKYNPSEKYEYFIIEPRDTYENIEVKTILQYAQEQSKKTKK